MNHRTHLNDRTFADMRSGEDLNIHSYPCAIIDRNRTYDVLIVKRQTITLIIMIHSLNGYVRAENDMTANRNPAISQNRQILDYRIITDYGIVINGYNVGNPNVLANRLRYPPDLSTVKLIPHAKASFSAAMLAGDEES